MPTGKNILIGLTGGIAAYKIPQLIREFRRAGANIKVVMTGAAAEFVTPLTLSTVSGNEVVVGSFPALEANVLRAGTWHIDLAQWADVMLIAPGTANTMAKLAHGYADNAVTIVALAMRGPVVLSPSMDVDMWQHPVTQTNVAALQNSGYIILPPEQGELASGLSGPGRLPDLPKIQSAVSELLSVGGKILEGKKILVTAGPTHEPIDPVRYIGNRSSGKMGFALATAAAHLGADVTLIAGPVFQQTPRNVKRVNVETAHQMFTAVMNHRKGMDAVIMAAAVADFTPAKVSKNKIKKENIRQEHLVLELKRTVDILRNLGRDRDGGVLVGFAVETTGGITNAKRKLREKHLDLIILNDPTEEGAGFNTDTNIVTIIDRNGSTERLKKMQKYNVAREILQRISELL